MSESKQRHLCGNVIHGSPTGEPALSHRLPVAASTPLSLTAVDDDLDPTRAGEVLSERRGPGRVVHRHNDHQRGRSEVTVLSGVMFGRQLARPLASSSDGQDHEPGVDLGDHGNGPHSSIIDRTTMAGTTRTRWSHRVPLGTTLPRATADARVLPADRRRRRHEPGQPATWTPTASPPPADARARPTRRIGRQLVRRRSGGEAPRLHSAVCPQHQDRPDGVRLPGGSRPRRPLASVILP